jgi:hypothetical protein
MAGAVLTSQLYAWLSLGAPGALLAAQGLVAGWGTALAGAPFLPSWAALCLGLIAGLAFPILRHALHAWLRHSSGAATIALALTAGPLGMLGIGFLADGRWGQGLNGIGAYIAGETTGQGVAGLFALRDTQQLVAQAVGLAALGVWGLAWGTTLGVLTRPRALTRSLVKRLTARRRRSKTRKAAAEVTAPAAPSEVEASSSDEASSEDGNASVEPSAKLSDNGQGPESEEAESLEVEDEEAETFVSRPETSPEFGT